MDLKLILIGLAGLALGWGLGSRSGYSAAQDARRRTENRLLDQIKALEEKIRDLEHDPEEEARWERRRELARERAAKAGRGGELNPRAGPQGKLPG